MSKYHAVKVKLDGYTFDSKAEATRYQELCLMQRSGDVLGEIVVHPPFQIEVNGKKICRYEADFQYVSAATHGMIYEDVKGVRTPVYRLKKKLVEACYGITITEVGLPFAERIPA